MDPFNYCSLCGKPGHYPSVCPLRVVNPGSSNGESESFDISDVQPRRGGKPPFPKRMCCGTEFVDAFRYKRHLRTQKHLKACKNSNEPDRKQQCLRRLSGIAAELQQIRTVLSAEDDDELEKE